MSRPSIRALLGKPLRVTAFRAMQAARLAWMERSGAWQRLARRLANDPVTRGANGQHSVLISAVRPQLTSGQLKALEACAAAVLRSEISLFGYPVPSLESCDFSVDWRFNKRWPRCYFRRYRFYEPKTVPYDVKFPWELSRLHYLVPVLGAQSVGELDIRTLEWLLRFLERWRDENPLAFSVNWYPMEASMRVLSLVMLLDFSVALQSGSESPAEAHSVLRRLGEQLRLMLAEHGRFVWITREFTDVRGNHFAANIVALLLAGLSLGDSCRQSARWVRYANRWLDAEVARQFLSDGVNIEKSCAYHKLVLELFALAALARQRCGGPPLPSTFVSRLLAAARFSDAVCRPDGTAAGFGDTDDAVALPFAGSRTRSHGAVVELIRGMFDAGIGSVAYREEESLAALFLTGRARPLSREPGGAETLVFPAGGYVIVRQRSTGFFLMIDVGEVGLEGRGGHGHNDLLSFELFVQAQPVVVDPGCPCYTADLAKHDDYRRTARHSTIQLFGEEMARLQGHWRIANDAHPMAVEVSELQGVTTITAGHDGYERVAARTRVVRKLTVVPAQQTAIIDDWLEIGASEASARWTFPVGTSEVSQLSDTSVAIGPLRSVRILSEAPLHVIAAPISPGYGREVTGCAVVSEGVLQWGSHRRRFEIVGDVVSQQPALPSTELTTQD